jgi:hypothetical protein
MQRGTMYTKLSADNVIVETLRDLGMSVNVFYALQYTDIVGKTCIERCVSGVRELDRSEASQLLELCRELRSLQDSFPVPIDWRDVRAIRAILQQRREHMAKQEAQQAVRENESIKQQLVEELSK